MKTAPRKVIKKTKATKIKRRVVKVKNSKATKKVKVAPKKAIPKKTKKILKVKPAKKIAKKLKPLKKVAKKIPIKAKPIKSPKLPKVVKHLGYTNQQYETYKNLISSYNSKTNDQLKNVLRANQQSMSGDKKTLLEKVADGEVKGAIPRCPKCGGGYLKYDFKVDVYGCKGYMDDTDWKFCNFRGSSNEVNRNPWVKPPGF